MDRFDDIRDGIRALCAQFPQSIIATLIGIVDTRCICRGFNARGVDGRPYS